MRNEVLLFCQVSRYILGRHGLTGDILHIHARIGTTRSPYSSLAGSSPCMGRRHSYSPSALGVEPTSPGDAYCNVRLAVWTGRSGRRGQESFEWSMDLQIRHQPS